MLDFIHVLTSRFGSGILEKSSGGQSAAMMYLIPTKEYSMTKAQLKKAKAELKRINAFIAEHELGSGGFEITEHAVNTKAHGERYVFIKLDKDDLKLRKQLKDIRYGAQGRGKARWMRDAGLWSIKASALEGTVFGS